MALRMAFSQIMLSVMESDPKVVVILGDIGVFAFKQHAERWPQRVINAGVAECAMVGFAAGLSMAEFFPVVSTIDSFLLRRAYEFIRLDFCEQKLPGLFVTVGGSNDYAKLGPTHQCPEGSSIMAVMPGMRVTMPRSESMVASNITTAVTTRDLCYIRLEESAALHDAKPARPKLHLSIPRGTKNGHADIAAGSER